jgi:15-cis-phytoene synthase
MTPPTGTADLRAAYEHCAAVTRREARNFYYAFVTLPRSRRQAVYAVYAFSRVADDIADGDDTTRDKSLALSNLRGQLETALQGMPEGPVFTALADAARTYRVPDTLFHDILDGVEMDLTTRRYKTFEALRRYCYGVASAPGLVSIRIFGYRGDEAEEYATDFGLAMQLTNILRDLREDMERDRVYLPQEELRRFGYSDAKLRAGIMDEDFLALMRFQTERARGYFLSARRLLPLLEPRSRPCAEGLHQLYRRLLDRIEARGFDVFSSRVSLPTCEKMQLTCKLWATSFIPHRNN